MSNKKTFKLEHPDQNKILLLGLISEEKEYRLSWLLNKNLGLQLSRGAHFLYNNRRLATTQEFPSYTDQESTTPVQLIRNQSSEGVKIPDYKQFDYLLITSNFSDGWISQIRAVPGIRALFELDPSRIQDLIGS